MNGLMYKILLCFLLLFSGCTPAGKVIEVFQNTEETQDESPTYGLPVLPVIQRLDLQVGWNLVSFPEDTSTSF